MERVVMTGVLNNPELGAYHPAEARRLYRAACRTKFLAAFLLGLAPAMVADEVSAVTMVQTQAFGSGRALGQHGMTTISGSSKFDSGATFALVNKSPETYADGRFSFAANAAIDIGAMKISGSARSAGCLGCFSQVTANSGASSLFQEDIIFNGEGVGNLSAEIKITGSVGKGAAAFYSFQFDTGDELNGSGSNSGFFPPGRRELSKKPSPSIGITVFGSGKKLQFRSRHNWM